MKLFFRVIILLFVVLFSINADAQTPSKKKKSAKRTSTSRNTVNKDVQLLDMDDISVTIVKDRKNIENPTSDHPFYTVEKMPQFPGGESKMFKFIGDNMVYPEAAFNSGLEGRAMVRFVVGTDGVVSNTIVVRGFDKECDKEAKRLVELMPKWIPGRQNGMNVEVYYNIPILFKIDNEKKKRATLKTIEPEEEIIEKIAIIEEKTNIQRPFVVVEQMPEFPGGDEAKNKFIAENLKYPSAAYKAGLQGKVYVRFVVETDGTITNLNILRGFDPKCDKEAKRVIESMPKWIPGKQNGMNVRVYYTIPIVFRLTN